MLPRKTPHTRTASEYNIPGKDRPEQGRRFLPFHRRGMMLDLSVFLFNLYLLRFSMRGMGSLLSRTYLADDPHAARTLLIVISVALVAQIIGSIFKRRSLQARLLAEGQGFPGIFALFLILHFALTLVTVVGIMSLLPYPTSGGMTVLAIFLSMIPTALVWRALTPYKTPPEPDWRNSRVTENLADLFLVVYMMVNLSIWSIVTAGSNVHAAGFGEMVARALGFVLMSPVLLLFYIPPRLLFLVEDYKYPATWLSMTFPCCTSAAVSIRFSAITRLSSRMSTSNLAAGCR